MKKTKFLFLILFLGLISKLPSQTLDWAHLIEAKVANGETWISEISSNENDELILNLFYNHSANFEITDSTIYNEKSQDFRWDNCLVYFNKDKSIRWFKKIETKDYNNASNYYSSTNFDKSGNVVFCYLIVDTTVVVEQGLYLYPHQDKSYWLVVDKYSSNGNLIFHKEYKGLKIVKFYSQVMVNSENNIVLNGYIKDSVSINLKNDKGVTTYYTNGRKDLFILSIDSVGDPLWLNQFKSYNAGSNLRDLNIDKKNNILVVGYYYDSININKNNTLNSLSSNFLLKFNSKGDLVWKREFPIYKKYYSWLYNVTSDDNANIYLSGNFCLKGQFKLDTSFHTDSLIQIKKEFTRIILKLNQDGYYLNSLKFINSEPNCPLYGDKLIFNKQLFYGTNYVKSIITNDYFDSFKLRGIYDKSYFLSIIDTSLKINSFVNLGHLIGSNFIKEQNGKFIGISVSNNKLFMVYSITDSFDFDFSLKEYLLIPKNKYSSGIAKYSLELLSKDSIDDGYKNRDGSPSSIHYFQKDKINIYPNPFDEKINIQLDKISQKTIVSIFDISGREIQKNHFETTKELELNTKNLAKGLYNLKLESDGESNYFKITKE